MSESYPYYSDYPPIKDQTARSKLKSIKDWINKIILVKIEESAPQSEIDKLICIGNTIDIYL